MAKKQLSNVTQTAESLPAGTSVISFSSQINTHSLPCPLVLLSAFLPSQSLSGHLQTDVVFAESLHPEINHLSAFLPENYLMHYSTQQSWLKVSMGSLTAKYKSKINICIYIKQKNAAFW
ncbi:hypothetical protein ILYODFUR_038375 [Ilyodon furcidens]|uniref:Uncharacterized protein n=1 Tax=Ilyodon furcidens TaxID=33524 RepID=A0ABV0V9K2_9TELE